MRVSTRWARSSPRWPSGCPRESGWSCFPGWPTRPTGAASSRRRWPSSAPSARCSPCPPPRWAPRRCRSSAAPRTGTRSVRRPGCSPRSAPCWRWPSCCCTRGSPWPTGERSVPSGWRPQPRARSSRRCRPRGGWPSSRSPSRPPGPLSCWSPSDSVARARLVDRSSDRRPGAATTTHRAAGAGASHHPPGGARDRRPAAVADPTRGAPSMASVIHYTIATEAEKSSDFRRVLWTGENAQLVIMTIPPGGEIGEEVHEDTDQILTFVSGAGEAQVSGSTKKVAQGDLVVVPAGKKHNFVNTGQNPLILYTVYGPPEHADGAVHTTKEEADELEEAGKDEPPAS